MSRLGYYVNNTNLSEIFQSYSSGTKTNITNIKINGTDISNLYKPYTTGTKATTNLYKINNNDLSNLFEKKTPYVLSTLSASSSSNCNGIFSTKLLVSDYTGHVIRIRRGSDNTYMNFYSDTSGNLTSNANGTGTTISTFLNATTGYVDTWYDQSGKGNNAYQTTTASQPTFDVVRNCVDLGYTTQTNLFLNMPSGTVPVGALDLSYSFVVKYGAARNTTNGGFIGSGIRVFSTTNCFRLRSGINSYANYWHSNDIYWSDSTITATPIVAAITYNGTTKNCIGYMNGVSKFTGTRTGMTNAEATQTIGVTVASEYLRGRMFSLIIFPVELTSTDIENLNVNVL